MLNHLETVQQSDLRYPEARIVGTTAAQDKLLAAQALPRNLSTIDYDLELNQVWVIITVKWFMLVILPLTRRRGRVCWPSRGSAWPMCGAT